MPTADSMRVKAVQWGFRALGIGVYTIGAATGSRTARFLGLRAAGERALARGDPDDAESLARELLRMAERFKDSWNYGNALHHGHLLLGMAALARDDVAGAEAELLEAGRTPGSPQLNSFGPHMVLASKLLQRGRDETVLRYLDLCQEFWCPPSRSGRAVTVARDRLEKWRVGIGAGRLPDFGPNLVV